MSIKSKIESFTMQFADIKPESCELHIMWEKTAVALPIPDDAPVIKIVLFTKLKGLFSIIFLLDLK